MSPIPETVGTLNLKILRFEHHLKLLYQQQSLSDAYPEHKRMLAQKAQQAQLELSQLVQYREELLKKADGCITERSLIHGCCQRQTAVHAVN